MLRQHCDPGLAMTISVILMHWRNGEELHPIQRLIHNLQAEMHYQDLLGWDKFCYKKSFLEDSGQTSLGEVGMTKVVRHIWELQKRIYDHRNIYFHVSNGTINHNKG